MPRHRLITCSIAALMATSHSANAAEQSDSALLMLNRVDYLRAEDINPGGSEDNFAMSLERRWNNGLELVSDIDGRADSNEFTIADIYIRQQHPLLGEVKYGLHQAPIGAALSDQNSPNSSLSPNNPVEQFLLPSGWQVAGIFSQRRLSEQLALELAVHNGLQMQDGDRNILQGRHSIDQRSPSGSAISSRLNFLSADGPLFDNFQLSLSLQHQSDISDGGTSASAQLLSGQASWQLDRLTITALYADWSIEGRDFEIDGHDLQRGGYLQGSYQLSPKLALFSRYNQWDNQAGSATESAHQQVDMGLQYTPNNKTSWQLDLQNKNLPNEDSSHDAINLGLDISF